MDFLPIINDENVFDETFIPEKLVCREGQIKEIARCIGPARSGKSIRNLLVYGPPGVGKTIVCKSLLNYGFSKKSVYVNCWSKRTSHKIWEEILLQMGYVVHDRESTSALEKEFERSGRRIIVCLDEADQLRDTRLLYLLARNGCGVILISNTVSILSKLDDRTRSSLLFEEIEFKPYTKDEILAILKERVTYGFRPGALSTGLLEKASTMSGGDARIGLQMLRMAAKDAESKELEAITIEEIKSAAKCARKYRLSYLLAKLNEHQRVVYTILKKSNPMESGRLYSEYRKSVTEPVVDRAYRKHMARLEELGLVKSAGTGRWKKYATI